ncbi:SUF system Fe-S cluster assembly regulator [Thermaurantiacus sp.]
MLRLSNFADYGVVIMTAAGRAGDRLLSASHVSLQTGIPVPTVAKLMNQLARAGLLVSHRGVSGGFTLARPAATISLADIVEAIDGPIALTHCCTDHAETCEILLHCTVRLHWEPVNRAVREALSRVSLATLAGLPEAAPAETLA